MFSLSVKECSIVLGDNKQTSGLANSFTSSDRRESIWQAMANMLVTLRCKELTNNTFPRINQFIDCLRCTDTELTMWINRMIPACTSGGKRKRKKVHRTAATKRSTARAYRVKMYKNRSEADKEAQRAYVQEWKAKRLAGMSPEEIRAEREGKRIYGREWRTRRKEAISPE
ncbi:unnamed protein product [Fusarium graminearum]|nr:unnamed protein product [Fusarium graminearum]